MEKRYQEAGLFPTYFSSAGTALWWDVLFFTRASVETDFPLLPVTAGISLGERFLVVVGCAFIEVLDKVSGDLQEVGLEITQQDIVMGNWTDALVHVSGETFYWLKEGEVLNGDFSLTEIPGAKMWVAPEGEFVGALDGQSTCLLSSGRMLLTNNGTWQRIVVEEEYKRLFSFTGESGHYNGERTGFPGDFPFWDISVKEIPELLMGDDDSFLSTSLVSLDYPSASPSTLVVSQLHYFDSETEQWVLLEDVPVGSMGVSEISLGVFCEGAVPLYPKRCFDAPVTSPVYPGAQVSFYPWGKAPYDTRGSGVPVFCETVASAHAGGIAFPLKRLCIPTGIDLAVFSQSLVLFYSSPLSKCGVIAKNHTLEDLTPDVLDVSFPYPYSFQGDGKTPSFYCKRVKGSGSLLLDWGDGNSQEISLGLGEDATLTHGYSSVGGHKVALFVDGVEKMHSLLYRMEINEGEFIHEQTAPYAANRPDEDDALFDYRFEITGLPPEGLPLFFGFSPFTSYSYEDEEEILPDYPCSSPSCAASAPKELFSGNYGEYANQEYSVKAVALNYGDAFYTSFSLHVADYCLMRKAAPVNLVDLDCWTYFDPEHNPIPDPPATYYTFHSSYITIPNASSLQIPCGGPPSVGGSISFEAFEYCRVLEHKFVWDYSSGGEVNQYGGYVEVVDGPTVVDEWSSGWAPAEYMPAEKSGTATRTSGCFIHNGSYNNFELAVGSSHSGAVTISLLEYLLTGWHL